MLFASVILALLNYTNASAIQGSNLGGWFVLEPWITPAMFYQFLNHEKGDVAQDSWSFCEVLKKRGMAMSPPDPMYANKWMRAHYNSWYTEEIIANLSMRGIERVRLPIGDWTMNKYGPYIDCMEGDEDRIEWLLDTAAKYNIGVLLDVHTAKNS